MHWHGAGDKRIAESEQKSYEERLSLLQEGFVPNQELLAQVKEVLMNRTEQAYRRENTELLAKLSAQEESAGDQRTSARIRFNNEYPCNNTAETWTPGFPYSAASLAALSLDSCDSHALNTSIKSNLFTNSCDFRYLFVLVILIYLAPYGCAGPRIPPCLCTNSISIDTGRPFNSNSLIRTPSGIMQSICPASSVSYSMPFKTTKSW